jgi:hypothetical protein
MPHLPGLGDYRRARSEKSRSLLSEWHFEQPIFDIINDAMSDRHKTKLQDRSYREGASKEGKSLEEFRKQMGWRGR